MWRPWCRWRSGWRIGPPCAAPDIPARASNRALPLSARVSDVAGGLRDSCVEACLGRSGDVADAEQDGIVRAGKAPGAKDRDKRLLGETDLMLDAFRPSRHTGVNMG